MSELEINLLLVYVGMKRTAIKARKSNSAKHFWLELYSTKWPRPVVKLPMRYWHRCQAEEREIARYPEGKRWTPEDPLSWIEPERLVESTKDDLIRFFEAIA